MQFIRRCLLTLGVAAGLVSFTAFGEDVAQIGEKTYASLDAAIAAAEAGDEITLLVDLALTDKLAIAKNVVLDLNEKTLTVADYVANTEKHSINVGTARVAFRNGTISGTKMAQISGSGAASAAFTNITFTTSLCAYNASGATAAYFTGENLFFKGCTWDYSKAVSGVNTMSFHVQGARKSVILDGCTFIDVASMAIGLQRNGTDVVHCITGCHFLNSKSTDGRPYIQVCPVNRVYIEGCDFANSSYGDAFAFHSTYGTCGGLVVFQNNTVADTVKYLSGMENGLTPSVLFGANTIADGVDKVNGIYKTARANAYSYEETLAAYPTGVTYTTWPDGTVYANNVAYTSLAKLTAPTTILTKPGDATSPTDVSSSLRLISGTAANEKIVTTNEGRWNYAATTAATCWTNAAAWADAANWVDGYLKSPSGLDNDAAFTYNVTGPRYVQLPDEGLTIGNLLLQTTQYTRFTGGKLKTKSIASSNNTSHQFFNDIDFTTHKDCGYGSQSFCGRVSMPQVGSPSNSSQNNWTSGSSGSVPRHRFDRGACSEDWSENIVNPAPTNGMQSGSGGGKFFFAPRGTSSDLSYSCTLTPGSKMVVFGPKNAQNVLPVGTRVTGDYIADDTFLQYLYDSTIIGLSKAPTNTVKATVTLSFKAYTPHVTQEMIWFDCWAGGPQRLQLNKYRKEDVFRLTLDVLQSQGGSTGDKESFRLDTESTSYEPGTLVLKNTSNLNSQFYLGPNKCHIEFDPTGSKGLNAKCRTRFDNASTTARVTCPAGATYQIGCLTNFVGTLFKDGPSTLTIGARGVANNVLVVEAGEVVWTNTVAAASGPEDQYLTTLAISNGATFRVAGGAGVTVKGIVAEKGAKILGPGTVRLPVGVTSLADFPNVTFGEDVTVEFAGASGAPATAAAIGSGAVVGTPAFWLDATATNSFTFWDADARTVKRWRDCRDTRKTVSDDDTGAGYFFATNISGLATRAPEVVTNAAGQYSYLKIAETTTKLERETRALCFSDIIKGIRAVFAVIDAHDGGGTILGGTARFVRNTSDAAYTLTRGSWAGSFGRAGYGPMQFEYQLVNNGATTVKNGLFYEDGEQIDGTTQGFFDFGRHLVESHPVSPGCWADAIGTWYVDNNSGNPNSNGHCRYQEIIVYTNELTYLERARVADYLTRKWFGHPAACESSLPDSATVTSLPVSDGTVKTGFPDETSTRLPLLSGTFFKEGDGTVAFDAAEATATLKVSTGRALVKSESPDATFVPSDGLFFHFDAAQTNTYAMDADKTIGKITDAAGGKVYARTPGKRITILENELNGHNVFDFGTLYMASGNTDWSKGIAAVLNDGTKDFPSQTGPYGYTTFMVVGSQGGGNSFLGETGNAHPGRGWVRYADQNGTYTGADKTKMPIFSYSSYWSFLKDYGAKNASGNWITMEDSTACKTRMFHIDGAVADPWRTEMTGGYQIVSYNSDDFGTHLYSLASGGQTCTYLGGVRYGEVIVYKHGVSETQRDRVEAYLAKKWFDRDTAGYVPATIAALEVASGATVEVDGNAPLTTTALTGAGSVEGALALAADAVFTVPVAADGSVAALAVSGAVDLSKGGTVALTGATAKLARGEQKIISSTAVGALGDWTVTGYAGPRLVTLKTAADGLYLSVKPRGFAAILR